MNINMTLIGEFVFYSMLIVAPLGYYLGRGKTGHPKITALVGALLCITPPLNIVYIIVLLLKNDTLPSETLEKNV